MKIIVGDETGLLKIVSYEDKKVVDIFGNQEKGNAIKFISFVPEDKSHVFAMSKSNILSLYKNEEENKTNLINKIKFDYEKETCGMNIINDKIILTNTEGESFVTQFDWTSKEFAKEKSIFKSTFNQINTAKSNTYDKERIMLLSKDSNPTVLDVDNQKIIWKARNVKNDYLDLKVPVNDLDVAFQTKDNCFVSTAYHKIRLYDLKTSNSQPVMDIQPNFEDSPFNKILISTCSNYVFVSNLMGSIFKFDTRKNLDLVSKFKGASGSIEDICLHPNLPFLGVVGLDRYLRIYNLTINKLTYKIYMKRKLNSCLFHPDEISTDIVISDEEDFEVVEKCAKKPNDEEIKKKISSVKKHRVPLSYTSFPKIDEGKEEEEKVEEEKVAEKVQKKVKTH